MLRSDLFILWLRMKLADLLDLLHEVGSLNSWTAGGCPCTYVYVRTDTDGAVDNGHFGFSRGSRW